MKDLDALGAISGPQLELKLAKASYVLLWIAIFWALMIGPEFPEELGPEAPPVAEIAPPPPRRVGKAPARGKLPAFQTDAPPPIDREAFIASFRRQAQTEALPCLRETEPGPASLHVAGTLLKAGKLKNLRVVGIAGAGTEPLPGCLGPAVEKMDFAPVAAVLEVDSHELMWRLDW